jgi:bifunctional ADP-heptose synthase (sugar kinase/adenylyltransferase)
MAKKVLIIGDTIVDKDINLKAIGLSLESPTIKTTFVDRDINYGGAANVAMHAASLGLDVTFVTCMKKDSEINFSKNNMIKIINLNSCIENEKIRYYINHGSERYKHLQINNTNKEPLGLSLNVNMNEYDVVAFSDYRCGTVSEKMIEDSVRSTAKTFGASQVSSHKSNFKMYMDLDFLVCNEYESTLFLRKNNVIITKGENGCEINGVEYTSQAVENPKNIIGAGDCFYAAFLAYEDPCQANSIAAEYVRGVSC